MRYLITPFLLTFMLIAGCAPTIGNKMDVKQASFIMGHTTQEDVMTALGLPNEMKHSKALKQAYWAYSKEPELMGIIIAIPDGTGTSASTHAISTNENIDFEFTDAAAVYVFNEAKTLIDIRYPLKEN